LIYVISGEAFAGTVDAGNDSRETWVYDMGADTWTRLADIPGDGFYSAGSDVGADGKIYCIGGIRDNNPPNFEGVVRVYDPGSDTWDTSRSDPPLPTGISAGYVNFPTVAGLPDGKLLYGGGQGWDNISSTFVDVADFWIYDPATDTFTPTTASSTASDMSWTILDLGNDAPAKDGNDIYIGSGAWSSFAKFTYSP
jgi:N-acetylneuraminic acid mutarotase